MNEKIRYWIGFNLVKGIGAVRFRAVLQAFGNAETAWHAPASAYRELGFPSRVIEQLEATRKSSALDRMIEQIERKGITVLTWDDADYPRRLLEIANPPPVLYIKGTLTEEDEWAAAVVGTRRVTAYGKEVTRKISHALARNNITVISGMARGVDADAHRAALDAGGRTLAILGCGVDVIYPPENRKLAENILQHGALISDYPPGTPPDGGNFPPRNRIISGMSRLVVVVEAGRKSGALITARYAAEQGRDVFAVPGNIFAPQSKGTNMLIQQGARPLLQIDDVLEALDVSMLSEHKTARIVLPENATEAALYNLMDLEPMHIDELAVKLELPIDEVTATLTMMELKGMVRHLGGMRYIAVKEQAAPYETSHAQENRDSEVGNLRGSEA